MNSKDSILIMWKRATVPTGFYQEESEYLFCLTRSGKVVASRIEDHVYEDNRFCLRNGAMLRVVDSQLVPQNEKVADDNYTIIQYYFGYNEYKMDMVEITSLGTINFTNRKGLGHPAKRTLALYPDEQFQWYNYLSFTDYDAKSTKFHYNFRNFPTIYAPYHENMKAYSQYNALTTDIGDVGFKELFAAIQL